MCSSLVYTSWTLKWDSWCLCVKYSGGKGYLLDISALFWGRSRPGDVGGGGRAVLSGRFGRGEHFGRHRLVLLPGRFPCRLFSRALYTCHTTNCSKRTDRSLDKMLQGRREQKAETPADTLILTRVASVEVVVILRDIRQDTEAVRNPKSHHVFCIQQSWNSQLLLCNLEGLQTKQHRLYPTEWEKCGVDFLFFFNFFLESRPCGQKTEMGRWNHIKSTVWLCEAQKKNNTLRSNALHMTILLLDVSVQEHVWNSESPTERFPFAALFY